MVDIHGDAKRQGIYLALFTDPEWDSCFSICHISWIKMKRITFCKLKMSLCDFVKWFLRLLLQIQHENNFLPASKHWQVSEGSQGWSLHVCSARMLYHDRLETIEKSQSTNSAKTLKIFNVYSSLGLVFQWPWNLESMWLANQLWPWKCWMEKKLRIFHAWVD